eukprot:11179935-Alexandrium_andersonii.AAC.1
MLGSWPCPGRAACCSPSSALCPASLQPENNSRTDLPGCRWHCDNHSRISISTNSCDFGPGRKRWGRKAPTRLATRGCSS